MSGRLRAFVATLALGAAVAACEPSGPGSLNATVTTPVPAGAVVIELAGQQITGFEGVGGTRAFAADATPTDTLRRVIVVAPDGVPLKFKVSVQDLGVDPPRGLVVEAVDLANKKITTLTGFTVRIAR